MKNNKFITLEHIRNNYYTYNEIADNGTFPLIEFLTGDYRSFKKFYWEEYFDKGIPILPSPPPASSIFFAPFSQ